MQDLFDDFMELLPQLIGAVAIVVVGFVIFLLGPIVLYRRFRRKPGRGRLGRVCVGFAFWCWTVMVGLVILSLGINTLGIEPLQEFFDEIIASVPKVIVAGFTLGIASGVFLLAAGIADSATRSAPDEARTALSIVGWLVLVFPGTIALLMVANTVGWQGDEQVMFGLAALVSIPWMLGLRQLRKRGLPNPFRPATEIHDNIPASSPPVVPTD